MIFVDTSAWYAAAVPSDPNHLPASQWLRASPRSLITTDYVIDEILTLLQARGEKRRALELGRRFFEAELCHVHYVTQAEFRAAWEVFRSFADKAWSFTDCTSKIVIEQLGLTQAFSFDAHFRQFGSVEVVP